MPSLNPEPNPPDWITTQEAATIIGISRRAVAAAIREGRLNAQKLPGRTGSYLLSITEVRKYAELRKAVSA